MQPTRTRTRRASVAASSGAVVALVAASVLIASPAQATITETITYTTATQSDFLVPAGVSVVNYEVVGGAGGDGVGFGGTGGWGATVTGSVAVTPGQTLNIWAGQDGTDGGGTGGPAGAGGAGYRSGGSGGTSGNTARPGAGGGGSSAIERSGVQIAVAGGGGGGGGRGADDGLLAACNGGNGGNAGSAGSPSGGPNTPVNKCPSPGASGGTAGANATAVGGNGSSVPVNGVNFILNTQVGGGGGAGAGGGVGGSFSLTGGILGARTSGGGGGGGGANVTTGDGAVSFEAPVVANGSVTLTYDVTWATTTTLSVDDANPVIGQDITFTAIVTNNTTADQPSGTMDFGVTGCNSQPLTPGPGGNQATSTCVFPAGPVGPHAYHAVYVPTPNTEFGGSSSPDIAVGVAKGDTTTVLTLVPDPVVVGNLVAFTATVTIIAPADTPLTGNVEFRVDGTLVAVVPVNGSGVAEFDYVADSVGDGTKNVTATFLETANLLSSSDSEVLNINQGDTTTTVVLDPAEVVTGGNVKATATVALVAPADAPITGYVEFYQGITYLGTGSVDPVTLKAEYTFPTSTLGTFDITAIYTGNDDLRGSESDPAQLIVKAKPLPSTGAGDNALWIAGGAGLLLLGGLGVLLLVAARRRSEA